MAGVILSLVALGLLIAAIVSTVDDDEPETASTTTVAPDAVTTTEPPAATEPTVVVVTPTVPNVPEQEVEATLPAVPEPEFPPGFPTPEQWADFRDCQTGGDYTAVNPAGTNYGAYQFRIATWDELAARRYPSLVGVVPSEASPEDQDKMGFALWEERGADPWPGCAFTISAAEQPAADQPAADQPSDETPQQPTPTTTTAPPSSESYDPNALGPILIPVTPNFPTPEQWAAFRDCQTGGDYTAVNPAGTNFGAYQFRIATWDELASRRYPSLVGVLPSVASPRDQDRMGYTFWLENGISSWPDCGGLLAGSGDASIPDTSDESLSGDTLAGLTPPSFPSITANAQTTTTVPQSTVQQTSTQPTAIQWANLRQCESLGNYTIVSSNQLYYGAYQFSIATWDDIASRHAPQLVGVLPSAATQAQQDFLAQKLYDERSWRPWPICGARYLQ